MCGSTMKTVVNENKNKLVCHRKFDSFLSTEIKVMKRFSLEREWEN